VDLTVENWPIDRLKEYARNPRKNDEQVDRMVGAIREFGFRIPVVAKSDGLVIDGHLRLKAARKLGMDIVPVALADDLTEAQIKAFRLLANKSANWASWDNDLLALELSELQGLDFDLSLTGFDDDELTRLLAEKTEGLTDPDETPEVPVNPVTEPGDVWICGRHRIVCGDSTKADDVAKALNGVQPHLMVTDPPYGVEYDPTHRRALQSANSKPAQGVVMNDDRADWREAWALFPGDVLYVWHSGTKAHVVAESLVESGYEIRAQIVWAKAKFVVGRGHYHPHHEPCWYAVRSKGGATGHWQGSRKESTLWQIEHRKSDTGHGTQKPVECMKRPIENNSSPGQAVYEPFSGSGTTIIACEMTGRSCHAIELSPAYVDVAVKRWQDFAGKQAILEGDGRTFEEIAAARLDPKQAVACVMAAQPKDSGKTTNGKSRQKAAGKGKAKGKPRARAKAA
jgi:DNA modification methylase